MGEEVRNCAQEKEQMEKWDSKGMLERREGECSRIKGILLLNA